MIWAGGMMLMIGIVAILLFVIVVGIIVDKLAHALFRWRVRRRADRYEF